MKSLKTIITILSIALVTISCSSDDGTDGTDGINGADGQQGATGPAGETGTANVIYSPWINAPAGTPETIDATSGLSTSIDVPELSSDILSKGTILVYMLYAGDTYTLPYTSTAGGYANTVTAISRVKKIKIFRFKHAADGTTVGLPSSLAWRYILIPGGVAAATSKAVKTDYSKMSYQEVCKHFNIQP
jgi:hypothetical protein